MKKTTHIIAAAIVAASVSSVSYARDTISVVGSSTVYPFATVVAERFGKSSKFNTPTIESTGSGGGLKLFCSGTGVQHPDITNASRRIKPSELELCANNGVTDVVEVQIGFDGIVLANSIKADPYKLTRKDIFLALAKDVPASDGSKTLVPNPYKTWKQVNSSLPDIEIEVLGPPPTSGTRDAFAELALEGGCKKFDWIAAIKKEDKSKYKSICHSIRGDGAYVEVGENDNLIIQKLATKPEAIGVFGFSFLDQNSDKVHGASIEGVEPEFDSIADKSYPISRPLFFYVKKAHVQVVPGISEYLAEFTSNKAWGEDGYLADKGMIPLPKEGREKFAANAKELKTLKASDLE